MGTKPREEASAVKVVYSLSARLGGSGIGYIAYNAVSGIYRAGLLARAFVSSNESDIPGSLVRQWGAMGRVFKYLGAKDPSGLIYHVDENLFDAWVAARLPASDVFHGWSAMSLCSLRKAKRRGMATVVERASSHPDNQLRLLREEYARWNVPLRVPRRNYERTVQEFEEADYITTPSVYARQSLIDAGIPERRLLNLPFGADPKRFQPATARIPHPFRAIFAGQVSVRKGVPYLLEAWARLEWFDAELWIVGGVTPDFAPLRHRWSYLNGVRFIDHTPQLARLFQQSDVFVFPSIEEGSALVPYEAMACGLPILTTPNAGSVARNGIDGFIVPIRDVDALCDGLQRLRDDEALRSQMSRSALAWASEFTWDRYRSRLLSAYEQISHH